MRARFEVWRNRVGELPHTEKSWAWFAWKGCEAMHFAMQNNSGKSEART